MEALGRGGSGRSVFGMCSRSPVFLTAAAGLFGSIPTGPGWRDILVRKLLSTATFFLEALRPSPNMDTHNKKSPFPDGKRDLFFLVNFLHKSHNGLERTAVQLPGLLEKAPHILGKRISFIEKFLGCDI